MKERRILKNAKTGKKYIILKEEIPEDDYISYACYYRYKNGKAVGNWMGLSWYTTMSHAIRGFRRRFKGEKMILIKS
jgi:hypothetical protein